MNEETKKPNEFGKALQEWWDSDAHKQLVKSHKEDIQRAVGKYRMLSEEDKIDMVQAICYIMCEAEKEGVSHRGLQSELGIYPAGFWVEYLMDVHNALWTLYHDEKTKEEFKKVTDEELKTLLNFTENEKQS